LNYNLQINEDDGVLIKKYPPIGLLHRHRSRTHYYVITTTSIEYHMVTLRNINNENPAVLQILKLEKSHNSCFFHFREILAYIDLKNRNRNAYTTYFFLYDKHYTIHV